MESSLCSLLSMYIYRHVNAQGIYGFYELNIYTLKYVYGKPSNIKQIECYLCLLLRQNLFNEYNVNICICVRSEEVNMVIM